MRLDERLLRLALERDHERGARVAAAHQQEPDLHPPPGELDHRLAQSTSAVSSADVECLAATAASRGRRSTTPHVPPNPPGAAAEEQLLGEQLSQGRFNQSARGEKECRDRATEEHRRGR